MNKLSIFALAAAFAFSLPAMANHDGKGDDDHCDRHGMKNTMHEKGTQAFTKADKDNDGSLDREEVKALPHVAKNFDAIDTDRDGTVDREEIHQYMKDHHSK